MKKVTHPVIQIHFKDEKFPRFIFKKGNLISTSYSATIECAQNNEAEINELLTKVKERWPEDKISVVNIDFTNHYIEQLKKLKIQVEKLEKFLE